MQYIAVQWSAIYYSAVQFITEQYGDDCFSAEYAAARNQEGKTQIGGLCLLYVINIVAKYLYLYFLLGKSSPYT